MSEKGVAIVAALEGIGIIGIILLAAVLFAAIFFLRRA